MELKTSGFDSICVRPIEMLPVNRMRVALLRDGFSSSVRSDNKKINKR
jgi:hypothetical protein